MAGDLSFGCLNRSLTLEGLPTPTNISTKKLNPERGKKGTLAFSLQLAFGQ